VTTDIDVHVRPGAKRTVEGDDAAIAARFAELRG
jgi:hypothetical protein